MTRVILWIRIHICHGSSKAYVWQQLNWRSYHQNRSATTKHLSGTYHIVQTHLFTFTVSFQRCYSLLYLVLSFFKKRMITGHYNLVELQYPQLINNPFNSNIIVLLSFLWLVRLITNTILVIKNLIRLLIMNLQLSSLESVCFWSL